MPCRAGVHQLELATPFDSSFAALWSHSSAVRRYILSASRCVAFAAFERASSASRRYSSAKFFGRAFATAVGPLTLDHCNNEFHNSKVLGYASPKAEIGACSMAVSRGFGDVGTVQIRRQGLSRPQPSMPQKGKTKTTAFPAPGYFDESTAYKPTHFAL